MAILPQQVIATALEVDLAAKEAVAMVVVDTEEVVEAEVAQEDPLEDMAVDKMVVMEEVKVAMEVVAQDLVVAMEVMAEAMVLVAEEMREGMEVALLIAEVEVGAMAEEVEAVVTMAEAAEETEVEDLEVSRLLNINFLDNIYLAFFCFNVKYDV